MTYGLANRVLVRKAAGDPAAAPSASAPRELLNVSMTQSYYTDPFASQFDSSYQSSHRRRDQLVFADRASSPAPTDTFTTGQLRMEFDHQDFALRTIQANGSSNYRTAQVERRLEPRRIYTTAPSQHTLNASTTRELRAREERRQSTRSTGTSARGYILQQRWMGFYNAQCCGLAWNTSGSSFPPSSLPAFRRTAGSISRSRLAGVGSFSNFFGAFGGGRF